ncbi:tetratricopeptide repeat protein [Gemmata sp. JC673]|uniref:Tetratricopeptide repeat protein n=1 Tax=Gemmata algarum TaxID=2975278 RepID=A0ABU5F269_9BACT|nr:tetratricopeptide repeat protein [Gemmata algarum]MDY3561682.1 tetratricopeptide repeat protein [Gemmata algarum]
MSQPTPKKGGPGVPVNVVAIKAAREAKGWSQKTFAKEVGCDARVVERIESRGTAALKTLADMAEALGVTPESLRPPAAAPQGFSRSTFQLPPSLPDFTGREDELRRITDRLRGVGKSVGISSALRGMGGIGKTVTAIEAAWEVKDEFPDGQLVVELRGMSEQPLTAVQAMSQLIRDFHPEVGKLPDDEKGLQAMYRQTLEGKKALVLLDDAKDESQVRPLLGVRSVAFVITSRNTLELDAVESIRLGVLPVDEAFTLLRGIIGDKGTDEELRTVSELCGRLPLALRVAGDFLRLHENWSLPKYITALQDESKRLERLKGKSPDRDVEAVLGLSASELVRENAQLAERWQLLSVFPADFDAQAVAAVWDLKRGNKFDIDAADGELTALLERSLVQFDTTTDRYSLHDLMRPVARTAFEFVEGHELQASTNERLATAEERFAGFYCRVLGATNGLYLKGNDNVLRGLALFDREATNIRHGQRWAVQHRATKRVAAELCRHYSGIGAYVLGLRLFPREQIDWAEEAVTACREIGDRRGEGAALGNLGLAWAALGDARKAIGFHEQALAIGREIRDRSGEGNVLGNLGNAWAALGDTRKAIAFYEQHLAIAREIGDRRGEEYAIGNLGIAWKNLGDVRKAIGFHEQTLAIARKIGDRSGEGATLGNLGNAWADLGNAGKAIGFYEQHLAIAREIEDRHGEGSALGNLGTAWIDLGDSRKAIGFYEQRLIIAREIGDRRGEGYALGNLGIAWAALGDARKAIGFYEQNLAIAHEIGDRRGEGATLGNLGIAWAALGDARKAIGFYEQALVVAREIGDRRGEGNASFNMALALHGLGQADEAIRFAESTLAIFTEIESPYAEAARRKLAEWRGEVAT